MLKPPSWAKNAVPSEKGWINSKTGELLISRRHSQRQLIEYWNSKNNVEATPAPIKEPAPIIEADPVIEEAAPTAEPLIEADPVSHDHASMTKSQLADHAALEHGINLDTSMTKSQMIEELESQI
tara:strand:- start:3013 stop:3387 length:375 start_codon:yes stop_codon:yes gene_type:complete